MWTSTAVAAPALSTSELKTGRLSQPLGIGDSTPDFSWKLSGAGRAAQQSAYEIRVATSEARLASGPYLWQSGKVASDEVNDIEYGGAPLPSRQPAVWQVRVWDANGEASAWSSLASFETGLLDQSDWGSAKWIELAGRTTQQPLPIFARGFTLDKSVQSARLHISGLGLFDAKLNGAALTDEVLAPGYSNYQLSAEYRTYDVTSKLRSGANTLGVELGQGTAHNVKMANPAPGVARTNSFAWWSSSAVGSGTLLDAAPAGATNVRVSSVASYYVGGAINVDTGDGGERFESRTITSIGTAPSSTALAFPAAAGDTNVKVTSVTGLGVGDTLRFDGGGTATVTAVGTARSQTTLFSPVAAGATNVKLAAITGIVAGNTLAIDGETRTVTDVGTQGRATTLAAAADAGATNVRVASVTGLVPDSTITIGGQTARVTAVGTQGAAGTGLTLAEPLAAAAANGAAVRYDGTGVSFTPALGAAHAQNATVVNSGSGLTVSALDRAYATGTAVTTPGTGITFTPALSSAHAAGSLVTGSGNPIANLDASAGAQVTPRLIGRLEITFTDGSTQTIVTNRDWQAAFGPAVTDHWFGGTDYDARRELADASDLSASATRRDGSAVEWRSAGLVPAPNLTTKLAARRAEPVKVQRTWTPVSVTNPQPGVWVFDLGQNFAGWPELRLPAGFPAGTVVKALPAETLNANGTVNQASIGVGGRGSDIFATYTTRGAAGGETWHPKFNYFAMQYLQVTGLPAGFTPTTDLVRGLQLFADVPKAGDVETDNARINRLHDMSVHSIESNQMSTFTDCPGREKLPYGADYVQPIGSLNVNFDYAAYLRNMQVQLVEGQSKQGPDAGNVALKTPVYDWGYSGQFGDEINWGSSIVQVPWLLHKLYGDTQTMREFWEQMNTYMDFVARRKAGTGADAYIVTALLADWVSNEQTSQQMFGTWGYYLSAKYMSEMATLIGRTQDAARYGELAASIKTAYNARFYNTALKRYTAAGNAGTAGATQAAQAIALDAGLAPEADRPQILQALVDNIYAYAPFGGGPHFSAGHVGLGPVVRSLMEGGRSDVLWDVMQENTRPGYGFLLQPTAAHPNGMTTMPERWTLGDSQNHVILLQIEEWFHTGVAGIKQSASSIAYRDLVFKPTPVGDLTHAKGHYTTPQGTARSEWRRNATGITRYDVTVPANTTATVYVPAKSAAQTFVATGSGDAKHLRYENGYQVYDVASGDVTFLQGTSTDLPVGGTVPATLSLSLGAPATFPAFVPGVDRTYDASTDAKVISTAGDATLSVSDPGRLTNGAFSLREPLQVSFTKSRWTAPISNDPVTIAFKQHIAANEPLRTGTYSRTLTFTLSTTTP
ncbi:family 78 glycoside hydrolase catalytic domain [Solirubrobacter phytolaccae]|uniref:alpha-L-rhamnosidase n=1 Tax=Solirubrobacter phytolaccae TaxID=1404360 RepID=A0A9X3NCF2_9ACTN|nr:family 78 glycoside hydrolase catalytic domain [Solirubrobacter phytolaccae]MDA0181346.1 family 78 glycoside hydrolase catalytic domain [Solirubrobacter phytolaccae]